MSKELLAPGLRALALLVVALSLGLVALATLAILVDHAPSMAAYERGRPLSEVRAAEAMLATEDTKPAIYDTAVAPLVDAARRATEAGETKALLQDAAKAWKGQAVKLELKDSRDAAEEARYQSLRGAAALLDDLLG